MKYMGSKARIAKHILPIILKNRKDGQWYVEPFVGGANIIDKVDGNRIGNDVNQYLVAMWRGLIDGTLTPVTVTRELYNDIKGNKAGYSLALVGWVGFNCSYSGKWFGGYAGKTKTKLGTTRDYQAEAIRNVLKQVENIKGIDMRCGAYFDLVLPENCIIYCDPPYAGTTKYKDDFHHPSFWNWCRNKAQEGHTVFVSEYSAPVDFKCVWQKEVKSSLSANGKIGGSKNSVEKLFVLKGNSPDQVYLEGL